MNGDKKGTRRVPKDRLQRPSPEYISSVKGSLHGRELMKTLIAEKKRERELSAKMERLLTRRVEGKIKYA